MPDQETVKSAKYRSRGQSASTVLVGGLASMVLVTVLVSIGALMSKTTAACWVIARAGGQA